MLLRYVDVRSGIVSYQHGREAHGAPERLDLAGDLGAQLLAEHFPVHANCGHRPEPYCATVVMPISETGTREAGQVLVKIVLVLVVAVSALVFAQRQDLFPEWGFAGSCEAVRAPVDDGYHWYACTEGLLTGYPSLIGDQCTYEQRRPDYEYWSCPAPVTRFSSGS